MTFPAGQEEFPAICPYLGLADDADSHATYPTEAHRCYRLPNPTRIATGHQETYCLGANHVTCPVYLGEGARGAAAPAAASGATTPPAQAARSQPPRSQQPFGGSPRPRPPAGREPAAPRPGRQRPQGPVGPRPRTGGISMPILTIGLFALAAVVIVVAIFIQQAVSDDGGNGSQLSQADVVGTNTARTQTARASGVQPTQQPGQTLTPGANQTPGTGTPQATRTGTPGTGTPGTGAKTYTVKAGDFCGTIATANNITVEQLLAANPDINKDCTNLAVGQILKLP